MNHPISWRLIWKEYRVQRAFWISMVVLTLALQLLVIVFGRGGDVDEATSWLFSIALAMAALYALGCGATLFATEHEAGTYDFQRSLPVPARRFFFSKLAFAVPSVLAMIGVTWALAVVLAGWRLPEVETHRALWASWGFGAVELLVWGVFFSLLSTRPLKAAVLAIAAASVSVHLMVGVMGPQYELEPYLAALPARAVFMAILALVTVRLGKRWFRERSDASRDVLPSARLGRDEVAAVLYRASVRKATVLERLLWQHLRQSAGMLAVLSALVVLLMLTVIRPAAAVRGGSFAATTPIWIAAGGQGDPLPTTLGIWYFGVLIMALVVAPLGGASVFLGDHRGHGFRFLAERGVSPRSVWVSRQLIWAAAALSWTFAWMLLLLALGLRAGPGSAAHVLRLAGTAFGFLMLAYAAGQLCSMFFSSGILAGFFGVSLTFLLCFWAGLTGYLDVPWLWSVAPIPLVLLVATWLRTPHWLLERNTLRAWLPTVLALAVPVGVILTLFCAYRVYSIPMVGPGFDPQQFAQPATPEAQATAAMYRRALDLYVALPTWEPTEDGRSRPLLSQPGSPLTPTDLALLDENEASLRLTLEAAERGECDFFDPTGRMSTGLPHADFYSLGRLLVLSARRLESEGKLDAALQRYLATLRYAKHLRYRASVLYAADGAEREVYDCLPFWAAHPDQTTERIRDAIGQVEELQRDLPSPSDGIRSNHLLMQRILAGDQDAASRVTDWSPQDAYLASAVQRLPWEKARTERVLNLLSASDLEAFDRVESAVLRNETFSLPEYPSSDPRWETLERTTPWIAVFYSPQAAWHARGFVLIETERRAARLQLALAAWRVEHGRLPEKLDELVGPVLEQLPLDPLTAQPFRYYPEGLPYPVIDSADWWRPEEDRDVLAPAGKPFFRSAEPQPGFFGHGPLGEYDFVFLIPPAP